MIKYEKCCDEHEKGTIEDLTFSLFAFWFYWAVILVNLFTFFDKWLPPIEVSNSVILIAIATLFFVSIAANPLIVKLRKFYYESILKLPAFLSSARAAEEARKSVEFASTEIRSAQIDIRRYISISCIVKAEAREDAAERQEEQAFKLLEQLEKQAEEWLLDLNIKYAVQNPVASKRAIKIRIEQAEQRDQWHTDWENERNKFMQEHAEWKAAKGAKLRELLAKNAARSKLEAEQVEDNHISVGDPIKSIKDLVPRRRLPPRKIGGPSVDDTRNDSVSEQPKPSISSLADIDQEITSPVQSINMTLSGILKKGPIIEPKKPGEFMPLIGSHGFQELVVPEPEPTYTIGDERFAPPPGFRIRVPVESVHVPELAPELATVLEPGLIELDPGFVPEPAPESELALEPVSVVEPEPELTPELVFEATAEPVPAPPHTLTLPPKEPEPDEWEPVNLTRTRTPRAKADPEFDPEPAIEGRRKLRTNYAVVRNPKLRIMAIQIHGRSCCVCGFNFDAFFGKELARGYIEVHHLNNVASGERTTDPVTDLAPLCANCHAMADRLTLNQESPPRSIAQLRELLIPSSNDRTNDESSTDDE